MRGIGHIGEQQLKHHFLRSACAIAGGSYLGPWRRHPAAGGRKRALAVDFNHTGAAVTVGAQALLVAQMRNVDLMTLRNLQQRFPRLGLDRATIEFESNDSRRRCQ
jgi:hypothetical protein